MSGCSWLTTSHLQLSISGCALASSQSSTHTPGSGTLGLGTPSTRKKIRKRKHLHIFVMHSIQLISTFVNFIVQCTEKEEHRVWTCDSILLSAFRCFSVYCQVAHCNQSREYSATTVEPHLLDSVAICKVGLHILISY